MLVGHSLPSAPAGLWIVEEAEWAAENEWCDISEEA